MGRCRSQDTVSGHLVLTHRRADNSLNIFKPLMDAGIDENCGESATTWRPEHDGRGAGEATQEKQSLVSGGEFIPTYIGDRTHHCTLGFSLSR